jgi:UDP-GlcNAc:undecaprenyl-phosphate GlcNAc-1-phosphate transferase
MHARAVPVAGGVAVLISAAIAVAAAVFGPSPFRAELGDQTPVMIGLLLASTTICLVGVADDLWGLRGRHKLAGQLIAVGFVIGSGLIVRTVRVFDWQLDLGLLSIPFTMFWILGAINALNLIDGMDGLSSCTGLIISVAIAFMAVLGQQWPTACVAVALVGALIGFLCYNLPPASIFLGDSGSMLIGLVVGVLAIHSSLKAPATIALAAPVAALAIPIMDTTAAILRRKLTGRSIYVTDRGHLHHCLLRRGLSQNGVLVWVSISCLITGAGALASLALKNEIYAIVTALAVMGTFIVTRLFGYAEFLLLKERLFCAGAAFFHRNGQQRPHQTTIRLQGTADWDELWESLKDCATRMNLKSIRLDVNAPSLHEGYHAHWHCLEDESDPKLWHANIPLTAHGQTIGRLEIIGQRDQTSVWVTFAALAESLEDLDAAVSAVAQSSQTSLDRRPAAAHSVLQ